MDNRLNGLMNQSYSPVTLTKKMIQYIFGRRTLYSLKARQFNSSKIQSSSLGHLSVVKQDLLVDDSEILKPIHLTKVQSLQKNLQLAFIFCFFFSDTKTLRDGNEKHEPQSQLCFLSEHTFTLENVGFPVLTQTSGNEILNSF